MVDMIEYKGKYYLTVKDFATAAKISQQAVYKQLDKRLKGFTTLINDQTHIEFNALEKFYTTSGTEDNNQVETVVQPMVELEKRAAAAEARAESLEAQVKQLQKQLEFMEREIQEKNNNIRDLNELLKAANENVSQAQKLHLIEQTKALELKEQIEQIEEEKIQEEEQIQEKKKKHWWSRKNV